MARFGDLILIPHIIVDILEYYGETKNRILDEILKDDLPEVKEIFLKMERIARGDPSEVNNYEKVRVPLKYHPLLIPAHYHNVVESADHVHMNTFNLKKVDVPYEMLPNLKKIHARYTIMAMPTTVTHLHLEGGAILGRLHQGVELLQCNYSNIANLVDSVDPKKVRGLCGGLIRVMKASDIFGNPPRRLVLDNNKRVYWDGETIGADTLFYVHGAETPAIIVPPHPSCPDNIAISKIIEKYRLEYAYYMASPWTELQMQMMKIDIFNVYERDNYTLRVERLSLDGTFLPRLTFSMGCAHLDFSEVSSSTITHIAFRCYNRKLRITLPRDCTRLVYLVVGPQSGGGSIVEHKDAVIDPDNGRIYPRLRCLVAPNNIIASFPNEGLVLDDVEVLG